MGAKIVLPKEAKGATLVGTKVYINGVEIKDVTKIGIPDSGADNILEVTITLPLNEICYAE